MKHFIYLFMVVMSFNITVGLSACSEDDDTALQTSTTVCSFTASGGKQSILVVSNDSNWKATLEGEDAERFQLVENKANSQIEIQASENLTDKNLIATVRLVSGNATLYIAITQVSGGAPYIEIEPMIANHKFLNTGGEINAVVRSNFDWTVSSNNPHFEVTAAPGNMLVIRVGENVDDVSHAALVTVTALSGEKPFSKSFTVTQGTREDNPYYKLVGKWEIYCDQWMLEKENLGEGSYASFYLDEYVANQRYMMSEFFWEGTSIDVCYEHANDSVKIMLPLGWAVLQVGTTSNPLIMYFLGTSYTVQNLFSADIYGEVSDDFKTIKLSGLPENTGIGLVGWTPTDGFIWWVDIPYAQTPNIEFRKTADDRQSSMLYVNDQYNNRKRLPYSSVVGGVSKWFRSFAQ